MALTAVLVVSVGGAGVVATRAGSSRPEAGGGSALVAAGAGEGAPVTDQTTTVQPTTIHAVAPVTSTTASTSLPASPKVAAPTTITSSPARGAPATSVPGPSAPPSTAYQGSFTEFSPVPTYVPRQNPTSWSAEENGVAVRVRMSPQAPRVGDTVEFVVETWATVPDGTCCMVIMSIGYNYSPVFTAGPQSGSPCTAPLPRSHQEDRVTYRIPDPGPQPGMRDDLLMPRFLVSRILSCGNGDMLSVVLAPQIVVLYPAR